jgi:3-methyladenine DNA glycosylase AlkD
MASRATLKDLQRELSALADPDKARFATRFFKTGAGEYGAGDRFRGIRVPVLRETVRGYAHLPEKDAAKLLQSPWHEDRLAALFLLIRLYRKGDAPARQAIHRIYLKNLDRVNNWDLVDCSAEHLVGAYLEGRREKRAKLEALAKSRDLWRRRVAMIATFYGIRRGDFTDALRIAFLLRKDPEDLIHKAVGWMLREIGNRDPATDRAFLNRYAASMPRTMLRYAIEKFPEKLRRKYLGA